LTEANRASPLS